MKFWSLTAPKVVILTTFGAASDENFVKMTTFLFQCDYDNADDDGDHDDDDDDDDYDYDDADASAAAANADDDYDRDDDDYNDGDNNRILRWKTKPLTEAINYKTSRFTMNILIINTTPPKMNWGYFHWRRKPTVSILPNIWK